MNKIKTQANKVGELVFAAETGAAYKKTLGLTWAILRETGIFLWLVICLVFVGAEWFWKSSIQLGKSARDWYNDWQSESTEEPKSVTEMGQSALSSLSTGTESLLYKAKQQLGIEAEPPAPKTTQPQPVEPIQPSATPPTAEATKPLYIKDDNPDTVDPPKPAEQEDKTALAAAAAAEQNKGSTFPNESADESPIDDEA